jgi:aryl-alcohol dehydrogenase-like predicted oxidoreductase
MKENVMVHATLGNTGLLDSKLCFGTVTFGDGKGIFNAISTAGQAGADELVEMSIDGGINFFDTADNYTQGQREEILGQSLKNIGIAGRRGYKPSSRPRHRATQYELRQLDGVSALAPEHPGWVLPFQGADRLEPVDRWERFREAGRPN